VTFFKHGYWILDSAHGGILDIGTLRTWDIGYSQMLYIQYPVTGAKTIEQRGMLDTQVDLG
jgi:hypothetical protein